MMMSMLTMMSLITAFSLIIAYNPMSMGILILTMALIITMFFSLVMSSWLSFLIFLIYISGMLILFSYFVAITPNQTFPSSFTLMMVMMSMMPITLLISNPNLLTPMMHKYNMYTKYMYMQHSTFTLIMLALLLLLTMVIVVKIATQTKGPLRPFN